MILLSTGLPLKYTSPEGQLATIFLYVVNPPILLLQFLVPHGAHELEHSIWPRIEYPTYIAVSVLWWSFVRFLLIRLFRSRTEVDLGAPDS